MSRIDGIENAQQWVAENPIPEVSDHGIGELLLWVADLEEEADRLPSAAAPLSEQAQNAHLIMHVLRCAFSDPEGGRSERTDYFKVRLEAIKEARGQQT